MHCYAGGISIELRNPCGSPIFLLSYVVLSLGLALPH